MSFSSGRDPHLDLLLGDYDQKTRQWLDDSSSSRNSSPAAVPEHDLSPVRLLIDDYPNRTRDWFAKQAARTEPSGAMRPEEAGQPRLRLLIEEFNTGTRELTPLANGGAPASLRNGAGRDVATAPLPAEGIGGGVPAGEPPLDMEVHWEDGFAQWRRAMSASMAVHAVWIVILLLQPRVLPTPEELTDPFNENQVTMLAPPDSWLRELTQTAPNRGPVSTEFQSGASQPTPFVAPGAPAPVTRAEAVPQLAPPTLQPAPQPRETEIKPVDIEPLAQEPAREPDPSPLPPARSPSPGETSPGAEIARARRPDELPMPRSSAPRTQEPKLELETPPATSPGVGGPLEFGSLTLNAPPGRMIENAVSELARGGGGRQAVGDGFETRGLEGWLPPSPGNSGSNLELLSDPQGIDFRPYLMQVLSSVRRNWYAVIPESARLGFTRGRALIQFAIAKNGSVSKLVIASSAGDQPLDRAAVAGISASNPFPPLPAEYSGSDIRLQFAFLYNMK